MRQGTLAVIVGALVALWGQRGLAQKPQEVIAKSNGYPSGPHFNLNIHGKKELFTCDDIAGGGSVFVSEYGDSTIQYVSNKKSSLSELTVLDPCAEPLDGDPARVQLPAEPEGFYVFGAIRGKPNNGAIPGDPSSIVLTPNPSLEICNDDGLDPNFGEYVDCSESLLSLGLITTGGVYQTTAAGFERFDNSAQGKGKSKAMDITGLFLWTGYACSGALDTNGPEGFPDGVIDVWDVPVSYDLIENGGNGNGQIDEAELALWLLDLADANECVYFDQEWVFNVADLVIQDQTITNDGTKLFQVRFYPVATTEFVR